MTAVRAVEDTMDFLQRFGWFFHPFQHITQKRGRNRHPKREDEPIANISSMWAGFHLSVASIMHSRAALGRSRDQSFPDFWMFS